MTTCNFLRIVFLVFFSNVGVVVYSQTEKLRFEYYSTEKGRRDIYVSRVIQDKMGYLWFGTSDGLFKYDGYDFINYKNSRQDSGSIVQNNVFSLWEDKDGIIWIGTAEAGINKFDRENGKFTRYMPEVDSSVFVPPLRAVSVFNEDNEGYLWTGTFLGELRRFDKQAGKFFSEKYDLEYERISDSLKRHNRIYCIYKDRKGSLWIGDDNGLHKLKITPGKNNKASTINFTHYLQESHNPDSSRYNSVSSIYEDREGILWIGTGGFLFQGNGLFAFDPETDKFKHYLHNPTDINSISSNSVFINTIVEDTIGNLWIGTINGLNKLNKDRTQFTRYFNDPADPGSLSSNMVTSLLIDRSGILWIGNIGNGIDKLDPHQKPFKLYRHDPLNKLSLTNNRVQQITGDNSGTIWMNTNSGTLISLNKNSGMITRYQYPYKKIGNVTNTYISIVPDVTNTSNYIWISGPNGIKIFDLNTRKFINNNRFSGIPYTLQNNTESEGIYVDSQGILWLSVVGNGLKSLDRKTGKISHFRHDPKNLHGLGDHVISAILEDDRGFLWLGHGSVGLSRLDKSTGTFHHFIANALDSNSLSSSVVNAIYEDSKKNLWFGTQGGGLCRFNHANQTFTTYSDQHGLAVNTIKSIQEDTDGNLWLGTTNGISRFSPAKGTFTNYNSGDGLPSSIYSSASYRDKDGILYYGSSEGLISFDPALIKANTYIPPVVITRFNLFDQPMLGKNEAEEIVLKHDENFFSFEFAALNFTNSSNNQYEYQLTGVDKDWVKSGTRRLASYTEVGPGEYTFRVRASNNDGVWNMEGTSVRIIIQPPWWRTWIAYTFYGLCFLFAVFLIDRMQRRRLIEKEREKTRQRELEQAREIEKAYHELKVTQKQLIHSEKMASLGEITAGIAHEIQNPLNFVNNFSEINQELLEEMENELTASKFNEAISIARDIKENEDKINYHGKRADAIVKGMLQHSRTNAGVKEPTDINALTEEYLRIAFHGSRAKDNSVGVKIQTDFDTTMNELNTIRQDIGRALLNIFSNAFYALNEKRKQARAEYEPLLKVSTKKTNDKIEIRIQDNGSGIPEKNLDKIFQPFFTTKPSGSGTGLGLSMAYDIIKAHGGELSVESNGAEGAEFIIQLPYKNALQ